MDGRRGDVSSAAAGLVKRMDLVDRTESKGTNGESCAVWPTSSRCLNRIDYRQYGPNEGSKSGGMQGNALNQGARGGRDVWGQGRPHRGGDRVGRAGKRSGQLRNLSRQRAVFELVTKGMVYNVCRRSVECSFEMRSRRRVHAYGRL